MTIGPEASYPAVHLVGAGPGHPDLLTLRGLRSLQAAEVILVDALLEPAFADLFPEGATVIPVGKRCGRESTPQEVIHGLIVAHARAGRRVVRLKGGDPLVFGRGGEEALALAAAGIPFELVPGVSAAQAAASAAGVPLTHRGVARSLTFLEGHHLESAWAALPLLASGGTLAIYMGTRRIVDLASGLLARGADPALDLVLVEQALRPSQVVTRSSLALAAQGALRPCTDGPGLLLLGTALAHAFPGTSFPESSDAPSAPLRRPA